MVRIWWALARSVALESLRRKDLWVIAILGFLIMASAGALGFFGFNGLQVFAKDLAATVLGILSTVATILTTSRLIPDEVKNRTLYPLLCRPISRFDLLFGKLLGAILVSWVAFLMLCGLMSIALLMFGVQFEPVMLQYVVAKMMGLVVVASVTLALSTFMTPSAGATMAFVLLFGSSMIIRALTMAYETSGPAMQMVFKVLHAILPQVGLFDFGGRASNIGWGTVPAWVMLVLGGYMVIYSGAMMFLSWLKFSRQAV